jgi:hypothetical protein
MILDNLNRLVAAQAFSSSGAVTTNSLPLKVAGRDILAGEPKCMVFTVTTAAAVAGTETYLFKAQTATNADGTTGAVIIATTPTYTVSSGTFATRSDILGVGVQVILPIPPEAVLSTATHLAGFVVVGSSGTISCTVDFMPLSHASQIKNKYADAVVFA